MCGVKKLSDKCGSGEIDTLTVRFQRREGFTHTIILEESKYTLAVGGEKMCAKVLIDCFTELTEREYVRSSVVSGRSFFAILLPTL